jgi:hypothetical protein
VHDNNNDHVTNNGKKSDAATTRARARATSTIRQTGIKFDYQNFIIIPVFLCDDKVTITHTSGSVVNSFALV